MLQHIIIISLLCVAVHTLTREDCLFGLWQKVVKDQETLNYRTELFNPISECLVCMSSFWSCVYFVVQKDVSMYIFLPYATTLLILLLFSVLDNKVINKASLIWYLLLVCGLVFECGVGVNGFIVILCVSGLNRLAGKLIG